MNFFRTILMVVVTVLVSLDMGEAAEGISFLDFLMSSSARNSQSISFSPEDGKKHRRSFEQKYGPRGKLLIESMGQGKTDSVLEVTPTKGKGTKHVLRIKKRIVSTSTTISTTSPYATTTSSSVATSSTPLT